MKTNLILSVGIGVLSQLTMTSFLLFVQNLYKSSLLQELKEA